MARKILLHQTGPADVLKIESIPTPEPGKGEVRIRVKAIGLNRAEVNLRAGAYGQPPKFPVQIGLEAAREIDAIGSEVQGLRPGDKASVAPAYDTSLYGMYSDSVIAPARAVVHHPPNVTWEEAAATWMSFTTAWLGLVNYARVGQGDYVIINAASSSVGLSAIQVVRRSGGVPIALTRTPAKVQALKEAGASYAIVTEKEDVPQAVLKLTDNRGARVIFDAVGGKAFSSLVAAAAPEGVILVYGVLAKQDNTFPAIQVIRKKLTIPGVASTGGILSDDAQLEALKEYVVSGLSSGELRSKIAKGIPP